MSTIRFTLGCVFRRCGRPRGSRPKSHGLPRGLLASEGERRRRLGLRGERAAVEALRAAGYRIVATNVRTRAGEIDVLAFDGATLALVEVKATEVSGGPSPAGRVDHAKRRRLRLARRELARDPAWRCAAFRFDIVSVRLGEGAAECRILRGAFRA